MKGLLLAGLDMMNYIIIGAVVLLLVVMFIFMCYKNALPKKYMELFKNNARKIQIGMKKEQVIEIMGNKYSRSILENGDEILEWSYGIDGAGGSYTYNGWTSYSYKSGYKATFIVKFSKDVVTSFEAHNMD